MPITAVIGGQWGDEGKGAFIDRLAILAAIIARFQGGANAGHTIYLADGTKIVLHQIPSGILYENKICILGNGMVIDVIELCKEIEMLRGVGIEVGKRLFISPNAHLVLPMHKIIDKLNEADTVKSIGTTCRGIGPAYTDKAIRIGLRAEHLRDEKLGNMIMDLLNLHHRRGEINSILGDQNHDWLDVFLASADQVSAFLGNTHELLRDALMENELILAEGGQGALLDLDHGTYPYVTSSNTGVGGVINGLGVPPQAITRVIGIYKAYVTRVGKGAFPTEDFTEAGAIMSKVGQEVGATTGRPRRCGWFDLPLAKYTSYLNGVTEIAMTKLDVLSSLPQVSVCEKYEDTAGATIVPSGMITRLQSVIPIYRDFNSWKALDNVADDSQFPEEANRYLNFIERELKLPITMVGVGPKREQVVERLVRRK